MPLIYVIRDPVDPIFASFLPSDVARNLNSSHAHVELPCGSFDNTFESLVQFKADVSCGADFGGSDAESALSNACVSGSD